MVRVPQRCGLMSNYVDHLLLLPYIIVKKTLQFETVCKDDRQWLHHTTKTAKIKKGDIT